ncbi:MAG: hypothetical protein HOA57_02560 [Candidatus Magasanikbacteria bacterium]|jgi:hypothetical protein|nr:hypothetical protein [Candidatus Magasanikbacteria bacterium]MBT4314830.1 hypothetical protein [Candidatus Magasanikbacteria bacterium]MBT4547607.1 hypothetical protein [Candidatus Magasanikbacteria bacterium]MBT6819237.1 hypothetical protein [Candidatus Magasanikbacteria bacterium]
MSTHDTGKFKPWEQRYAEAKVEFTKEFPQAFKVLEVGGVHPDKTEAVPNPYKDNEPDAEDFRNVGEHCISVGICANKIAEKLLSSGAIDDEMYRNITERSLIHDANKRFEIFRKKARGSHQSEGVYDKEAYETMQSLLKDQGISEDLLSYVEASGKETGHGSLEDFISLDEDGELVLNPDRSIEDMIVHLADDMTSSPLPGTKGDTKFVTTGERMEAGKFKERYPFLYKEGLGFDDAGEVVEVGDCESVDDGLVEVKTYAQYQEEVARLICDHLQSLIDPKLDQDSEEYLKKTVNS